MMFWYWLQRLPTRVCEIGKFEDGFDDVWHLLPVVGCLDHCFNRLHLGWVDAPVKNTDDKSQKEKIDIFAPVPLQPILSFLNQSPEMGVFVHPLKVRNVKKEKKKIKT